MTRARPNLVAVVAHYDDEVLYLGGLLTSRRDHFGDVTIAVATNIHTTSAPRGHLTFVDHDELERRRLRTTAFRTVCERIEAQPLMLDVANLEQSARRASPSFERTRHHLEHELAATRAFLNADVILTHGSEGEYGHPQHQCVHDAVVAASAEQSIWTFAGPDQHDVVVDFDADIKQSLIELYRDNGPPCPPPRSSTPSVIPPPRC